MELFLIVIRILNKDVDRKGPVFPNRVNNVSFDCIKFVTYSYQWSHTGQIDFRN